MPAVFAALVGINPVVAGSITFTSPGTTSWSVPQYNTMTVNVWGGGAAGSGTTALGSTGGTSSFAGLLSATGGAVSSSTTGVGGLGGTGSGGTVNETGGAGSAYVAASSAAKTLTGGEAGSTTSAANGGGAAKSVAASTSANVVGVAGNPHGGGGTGASGASLGKSVAFPGGGGGGYTQKVFTRADLTIGSSVSITVGAGGTVAGATLGGAGAAGAVTITWS
jgi:hypothetical protein